MNKIGKTVTVLECYLLFCYCYFLLLDMKNNKFTLMMLEASGTNFIISS